MVAPCSSGLRCTCVAESTHDRSARRPQGVSQRHPGAQWGKPGDPRARLCFLVGPSGAGKTTIIRLINRDETVTTGSVFVEATDVTRLRRRDVPHLRRRVGVIYQDYKLLPSLTVRQNVEFRAQGHQRVRSHVGRAGGGDARNRRAFSACRSLPTPAFWRGAAARGHRPRACAAVSDSRRRRAHGKPRSGVWLGRPFSFWSNSTRGEPRSSSPPTTERWSTRCGGAS